MPFERYLWQFMVSPGVAGVFTGLGIFGGFFLQWLERRRNISNDSLAEQRNKTNDYIAQQQDEDARWWEQYNRLRKDLHLMTSDVFIAISESLSEQAKGQINSTVKKNMIVVAAIAYQDSSARADAQEVYQEEVLNEFPDAESGTEAELG